MLAVAIHFFVTSEQRASVSTKKKKNCKDNWIIQIFKEMGWLYLPLEIFNDLSPREEEDLALLYFEEM